MTSRRARSGVPQVLHILGSLDVGGAECLALDLCRQIPAEEVHQIFICLSGRAGVLAPEFEAAGARIVLLPLEPLSTLASRYLQVLREVRPTTVVSHVSVTSGIFLLLARAWGIPQRVARIHANQDERDMSGPRRAYRAVMRLFLLFGATHVLGVSQASVQFGLGSFLPAARRRREVGVVPNGVDTRRFRPSRAAPDKDRLVIVNVARASPEKNRQALPDILAAVLSYRPATLRIVGTWDVSDIGPGASTLENIGPTRDVPAQFHSAHVSVLPSIAEGSPGVVLESLACGVQVVATDLPGIREIASHCIGITLLPPDASARMWAKAITASADRYEEMREPVRASVLNSPYGLDASVTWWSELWRRSMEPSAAKRS